MYLFISFAFFLIAVIALYFGINNLMGTLIHIIGMYFKKETGLVGWTLGISLTLFGLVSLNLSTAFFVIFFLS